eukprot:m.426588 g.426588  ORF g.426588 m.426588 type:complete len:52 (-) comp21356_c1_seq6:468-623(-)
MHNLHCRSMQLIRKQPKTTHIRETDSATQCIMLGVQVQKIVKFSTQHTPAN